MAGIVLIDVSGHRVTDALLAAMLHQAFLLGAIYELDMFGRITRRLFENLNARFYKSSGAHKFVALIYGEISEDAQFRFLSAGQPPPAVFSNEHDRFMEVSLISFPPVGMLPSLGMIDEADDGQPARVQGPLQLNDWSLMGAGDILLLHTDGLAEHQHGEQDSFRSRVEQTVRRVKDRPGAGNLRGGQGGPRRVRRACRRHQPRRHQASDLGCTSLGWRSRTDDRGSPRKATTPRSVAASTQASSCKLTTAPASGRVTGSVKPM